MMVFGTKLKHELIMENERRILRGMKKTIIDFHIRKPEYLDVCNFHASNFPQTFELNCVNIQYEIFFHIFITYIIIVYFSV